MGLRAVRDAVEYQRAQTVYMTDAVLVRRPRPPAPRLDLIETVWR